MLDKKISRRKFLRDATLLVGGMGISPLLTPKVADALELLAGGKVPIVWLEGQSCSGCSISLLNAENPGPAALLTQYMSAYYQPVLSAATGEVAQSALERAIASENYILVIEGAIPVGIPEACRLAEQNFCDVVSKAAAKASAVIAIGTCAAFGGVPAAPPNLSGSLSVDEFFTKENISKPIINLPGCPTHPHWVVGTIAHLMKAGMPPLDEFKRPKQAYAKLVHDLCPYYSSYQSKTFATNFGEPGCQFKLGCQGVITKADCPTRRWNGSTSWCLESRGVCVGCAHPEFVRNPNFALYRFSEPDSDLS